ncbi:MAG: endonuclease/exonuclease/phosphatase family protein [Novosphingobium sp.]|nr:endonuclease/exonuclease/phosphatase family protein [Novosphingobium sp.]
MVRINKPILVVSAVAIFSVITAPQASQSRGPNGPEPEFTGQLSVMTYNVHGLPWPLAWGRKGAFGAIAEQLAQLRREGRQPHVIALQEAFTQDAKALGEVAGYHYAAEGPASDAINAAQPDAGARAFHAESSWLRGETQGKALGSGLQIFSDYPIVRVRKLAFPDFACAGYDCLANKGALMVCIKPPGQSDCVEVVTTHLNSRRASGASSERSLGAYRLQVRYLSDFIRQQHDPKRALIVVGDFNVGKVADRRDALWQHAQADWGVDGRVNDALGEAVRLGKPLSHDAILSRRKAKDWQFYGSGSSSRLELVGIETPFGRKPDGTMLSDHVGYTAAFSLTPRGRGEPDEGRSQ